MAWKRAEPCSSGAAMRISIGVFRNVQTIWCPLGALTGARTRAADRISIAAAGSSAEATSTIDETSASTRRISPAGSTVLSSGQAVAMEGTHASRRSQARPSVIGLTAVTGRSGARSAAAARRGVRGDRSQDSGGRRAMETLGHCRQPPRAVSTRRSGAVRVRRLSRDFPSLGPAFADDALEKHRTALARHAVIMASHVAANPIPHITPCF